MLMVTKGWKDRFAPPKSKDKGKKQNKIWATFFPKLLRLSEKEKILAPNSTIVYRRAKTLGQGLTNYKSLAHMQSKGPSSGTSDACNHCSLCGHHGKHSNMVNPTSVITSKSGKVFKLHQRLICKDSGIYVATCVTCHEQYVGQTSTSFTKRWNEHRSKWKKKIIQDGDKAALLTHYAKKHPNDLSINLDKAYTVTFVEKANDFKYLDILESRWISRLNASINICNTVLPKFR